MTEAPVQAESGSRRARLARMLATAVSALALYGAFPPRAWADAAWLALVPLILLARYTEPRRAMRWGFAAGVFAWLPSLSWVLRLHETGIPPVPLAYIVPGWIFLSAACALYIAAYVYLIAHYLQRAGTLRPGVNILSVFVLSAVWVGFEYVRGVAFTGFPWNFLGVSQYQNLAVIQIAEWGGVLAVSWVFAMVNAGIALVVARRIDLKRTGGKSWFHPELAISLLVLLSVMFRGYKMLQAEEARMATASDRVRVTLVQPNIAQGQKWSSEHEAMIYRHVSELSELAVYTRADLLVWPETAIPGLFGEAANRAFVSGVASNGVPILVGAMRADSEPGLEHLYNSALLVDTNGVVMQTYDKIHLVPYGEYVPFARVLDAVGLGSPLGWSCTPGSDMSIFTLTLARDDGPRRASFASLICFEDVFGALSRRAVGEGAEFLVNQTNDAWFDGSPGAVQHMANSVFRCVETRMPMVRVCNTGVTCAIDSTGRIRLLGDGTETAQNEKRAETVTLHLPGTRRVTAYVRAGDRIYAALGFASVAAFVLALLRDRFENAQSV